MYESQSYIKFSKILLKYNLFERMLQIPFGAALSGKGMIHTLLIRKETQQTH